jgi:hypothetical protein
VNDALAGQARGARFYRQPNDYSINSKESHVLTSAGSCERALMGIRGGLSDPRNNKKKAK